MLDWVMHQIGVGTLVVVFMLAVLHKMRDFTRFRASMRAYEIIPDMFLVLFAPLVIALELLTVVLLFVHEGRGAMLGFALLGTYTLVMALNLARGRAEIDCGCGDLPTPLSGWLIIRNMALMALALGTRTHPDVNGSPGAWVLVCAGVAGVTALYLIAEQLLANVPFAQGRHG
jgi:hypothetical protein